RAGGERVAAAVVGKALVDIGTRGAITGVAAVAGADVVTYGLRGIAAAGVGVAHRLTRRALVVEHAGDAIERIAGLARARVGGRCALGAGHAVGPAGVCGALVDVRAVSGAVA